MVSAIVKGRMGNFCYITAAAYAFAVNHGLEFHMPSESLAPHLWPVYFQHLQNPNWNPELETIYLNDDGHRFKYLRFDESWRDKNIVFGTKSIETGYFQSYKYTEGRRDLIRFMFGFQFKKQYGTVGIHVRRGDYLQFPDKHPPITPAYILGSVARMRQSVIRVYKYKFFSDDIEWCKSLVSEEKESFFRGYAVEFSQGATEFDDMQELMNCQYLIVSNSTFSVFAAMLNPHPEKVVYCPHEDNYFGPENSHLSVSDLYPKSFMRIKY